MFCRSFNYRKSITRQKVKEVRAMSADVDKTALMEKSSLLSGLPLLGITIAATFLGLVLIMLIALTCLLLLRKTGCFRRRRTKTGQPSSSVSSTKLLLKQSNSVTGTEANGKSNGVAPTESPPSEPKVDDQAPLMMTELPSTKVEPDKSLADRYSRNSWTTRNTSFRLAVEERPKIVQKPRRPNAQIIAELDDELELAPSPKELPKAEESKSNKISNAKSSHKQQAPYAPTYSQKKRLSFDDNLPPPTSPSKIFSPTRTSLPHPSTTTTASPSRYNARQSQSSSESGLRSSTSPDGSLATSGTSSPNTVIYKPMRPKNEMSLPDPNIPRAVSSERKPKPCNISEDYPDASGIYRAIPIREHEDNTRYPIKTYDKPVDVKIVTPSHPALAPVAPPAAANLPVTTTVSPPPPATLTPPARDTATSSIAPPVSTPATRPTKLKIPPPTLPKPKYVFRKSSIPNNGSGQHHVSRADTQPSQDIPGRVCSIESPTRQSFQKARDSIAASPAFSPEGVSNAKLSLATSPGQSPAIFPQALRNDRRASGINTAEDTAPRTPAGSTYEMEMSSRYNTPTAVRPTPADRVHSQNIHHSGDNGYHQGSAVKQPANNTPVPANLSPWPNSASRQPYSRHSIATGSVLTPSIPPWERSSSRATLRENSSPSPTRGHAPQYEHPGGHNRGLPIHRTTSLNDQQPSYPLRANVPRMKTSISNGTPNGRYDYPTPGHPRKVATIKPSSSIKHNAYQSFVGQMPHANARTSLPQGSYRVRPPTVDSIESNKARFASENNGVAMTTAFL